MKISLEEIKELPPRTILTARHRRDRRVVVRGALVWSSAQGASLLPSGNESAHHFWGRDYTFHIPKPRITFGEGAVVGNYHGARLPMGLLMRLHDGQWMRSGGVPEFPSAYNDAMVAKLVKEGKFRVLFWGLGVTPPPSWAMTETISHDG